MIAHLGMYAAGPANDTFWALIRQELGFGPETLSDHDDFWSVWNDPDLLFSQTCGYPYRARLHGKVQLVGTPDYGLEGCPPGYYRSLFIRRKDDTRAQFPDFDGARFAYNEALSQSGWAGPVLHMTDAGLRPGSVLETGGHALSLEAVATGAADFAALDMLTWIFLEQSGSASARKVTVFERSEPVPTLPYITSLGQDAELLSRSIEKAAQALPDEARKALHLRDIVQIPAEDYLALRSPPAPDQLCPLRG